MRRAIRYGVRRVRSALQPRCSSELLSTDVLISRVAATLGGDRSLTGKWFAWWLLVWLAAYVFIYALQLPAKGILDSAWVRMIGISVVVVAASWLVLALNGGPNVSNAHLAISVGGGLGFIMLLNTWG